jgi:hypothetical protein
MSDILQLKDTPPLAKGHSRLVFQHPRQPDWLVKVIRPDVIEERWGAGAAWYKRARRYGRFISYVREVQEYVVGCAATGAGPSCFQKVIGFADTDLGLGLVTEAVRTPDGSLAPSIVNLITSGRFGAAERRSLDVFFEQLLASPIAVSDMNLGALVYTGDATIQGRFVLIDGLGDATLLPIKRLSSYFNRRSKLGKCRHLESRIAMRLERARAAGVVQKD